VLGGTGEVEQVDAVQVVCDHQGQFGREADAVRWRARLVGDSGLGCPFPAFRRLWLPRALVPGEVFGTEPEREVEGCVENSANKDAELHEDTKRGEQVRQAVDIPLRLLGKGPICAKLALQRTLHCDKAADVVKYSDQSVSVQSFKKKKGCPHVHDNNGQDPGRHCVLADALGCRCPGVPRVPRPIGGDKEIAAVGGIVPIRRAVAF